jgi:transposase
MTPEQFAVITDPETLRAAALQLVSDKRDAIAALQHTSAQRDAAYAAEIATRDGDIKKKQLTIDALTAEIARLNRLRFAAKTEALSALQRALFVDTAAEEIAAAEQRLQDADSASQPEAPIARPAKAVPKREALPAHLPRITTVHAPADCHCATCAAQLVKIGEHVSEKLAYTLASFHVERHVHPQYACRACESVVAIPVQPAIIHRGMPAVSLLAQIIIAKYCDHLPLYRQQAIYARSGVELARSSLAEWVGAGGAALQPLFNRLGEKLLQQACLHADETPVDTLDPGTGKTRQSYFFAYRSTADPPIILFDYTTSRSGKHARQFLGDWRGALMVDDYAGYKALSKNGVTELACWVHVRRKFVDVVKASGSPLAQTAVEKISALYRLEAESREQGLIGETRTAYRQQHAPPLLSDLHDWLHAQAAKTLKNSGLHKAVHHTPWAAGRHWSATSTIATGRLTTTRSKTRSARSP